MLLDLIIVVYNVLNNIIVLDGTLVTSWKVK